MTDNTFTTRRQILAAIPVVTIAAIAAAPAPAEAPRRQKLKASPELTRLLDAHRAAYAAFLSIMEATDGESGYSYDKANWLEEKTLLAVCAFPARSEGDRRAKSRYLLPIEARGELDLPEHMRALLRSTMA